MRQAIDFSVISFEVLLANRRRHREVVGESLRNNRGVLKLADFGLARRSECTSNCRPSHVCSFAESTECH